MKTLAVVAGALGLCAWSQSAWSQSLDLSTLDKFAAKAKEANVVNLTHDQLQAAAGFVPMTDNKDGKDNVKKVMMGLDSLQVRNYEFEQPGEFTESDLDSVRAQVAKLHGCNSIVDSRSKKEHSQVFLCSQEGKTTGLIVIDAAPKELNVVYVKGSVNLSDLGKLDGMMGIPKMSLNPVPPVAPVPPTPPAPPRGKAPDSKDDRD